MNENSFFRIIFYKYAFVFSICSLFFTENKAQIYYNFETSDLSTWQQSIIGHWEISGINPIDGKYSLHQSYDNPNAGNDQISFAYLQSPNLNDTIEWSFRLKYGYSPSSANNWAVFLAADQSSNAMCPGTSISGICVGVNYSGSDDLLKIWKIENGQATIALQTSLNLETSVADSNALIVVKRLPSTNWEVSVAPDGLAEHEKLVGSGSFSYFPIASYFGIYYKYSSLQDQKLWIDDIKIDANFITDTLPPTVDTAFIASKAQVEIDFNEPISSGSLLINNFRLQKSSNSIDSVNLVSPSKVRIFLNQPIKDDSTIWIAISGITDLNGNKFSPITIGLVYSVAKPYDVLITEIMSNPEPTVGLPPYEYLELYNRSDKSINIDKWKLGVRNYWITFQNHVMLPKEYAIVCAASSMQFFSKYNPVASDWNGNAVLTNTGTTLELVDSSNQLISSVTYSDNWYNDSYKKNGGWSLEMVDTDNPCGGNENWVPSNDKSGGTPGRKNSVAAKNPDVTNPEFLYAFVPSNDSIILKFSEPLNFTFANDLNNFTIDNNIGNPLRVYLKYDDFSSIILKLASKLTGNKQYQLHIKKVICDCVGNQLNSDLDIPVALPVKPDSFDVVINEVLYNPYAYGSRFVELYNRSNKVIDAGSLIIANIDTTSRNVKSYANVADFGLMLFPGNYLAVTEDILGIQKFYQVKNKSALIETVSFPALPDKHGIIALKTKDFQTIDKFEYSDKMQFGLLTSFEGVSLERLNVNWPTQDFSNWHSASQIAGFATPGYANSEMTIEIVDNNEMNVSPEVFTPDNDGYDDYVTITINPEEANCSGIIAIYNAAGNCVCHLLSKTYLGLQNTFTWNGMGDNHLLQTQGIYIIYVELVYGNGKVKEFKKTCVLGFR